ncbi:MOB kinase activator 2-like [Latimeria chalumnae]|uniref:MOB kinase activator 2-like n=1 Tax=Latimeria chalumnae TaxID=7897 RepID=UPI0003C1AA95|nr:PREDICTED: MOB kinase activator 2-like [Latimeria chalumnae]XP_005990980.1 PREDICTED: MOB kinase activator 2-like [Latimeria chalumnae]XP_005990981.1 PREDICTED: MOB kinase activator 2-like [Latimeria chalumnae]|eukprot:XP_005990979.1 PREDICTED: MOB kinase activator 2-like [Latimeria chalumnae]
MMVFQAVSRLLGYKKRNSSKLSSSGKKPCLEGGYSSARIVDADLLSLVALPKGMDQNEWLASNTVAFFNHVNLLYSAVSDFCTAHACPVMAAWKILYLWTDERGKKVQCSAPHYVDYVTTFTHKFLMDEDLFPTKQGKSFPKCFDSTLQKIFQHLFHVLAHIYSAHSQEIATLDLYPHLNTLYLHFVLFAREFRLLDSKELSVMEGLTTELLQAVSSPQPHTKQK